MQAHSYSNPEAYSKSNSLQFNFAMEVISNLEIREKTRILDLGCGDGLITYKLAERVGKGCVIGADISEKMIQHANNCYSHQPNLRFIQMDTSKNIFMSQFDMVTSFNSMHWVKEQKDALRGIANALVEKGKVILLFSHKKSDYHHALDIVCSHVKWCGYFKDYINPRSFFEVKEYKQLLKEANLEVNSLVEEEMAHQFSSVEQFKAFLSSSMANIKKIPASKIEEFLNDFCQVFFKLSHCTDLTCIPVKFWCLKIIANKPIPYRNNLLTVEKHAGSIRAKL